MKYIKSLIICCLFITTTINAQVSVYAKVDHIEPDGIDTLGNITLTVSGSTAPYTYTWNPGAINTKDISNITAEQYTLNVRSASSQTYTNRYNVGYKVKWTNLNRCTFRNDTLSSLAGTTVIMSYAFSRNTLPANTDGWLEYVVSNLYGTGADYYIGFVDSISPIPSTLNDIDYGFYYWGQAQVIYSKEGATKTLLSTSPKIGDICRIERIADTIFYKINNVQVRKKVVTGVKSKVLKLKSNLGYSCSLINVGCSFANLTNYNFPNYVEVAPTVFHASGPGINDGKIALAPKNTGVQTYTWIPSGTTGNTSYSLSAGQYSINAQDSSQFLSYYRYNVGYKTKWTNLYRATQRNDTLICTSTSAFFGSACSKNYLRANTDGWMEIIIPQIYGTTNDYWIGFCDSLSPNNAEDNDIDFGFYYWGQVKYLFATENGSTTVLTYAPNKNDILRLERKGDVITYKINGVDVRIMSVAGISHKALVLKTVFRGSVQLPNIGCSFSKKDSLNMKNYVTVKPLIKHSSGPGVADGNIRLTPNIAFTNTYSWSPGGATTNSISTVGIGNYSVTVKDSLLNESSYSYNIGYKVQWTNFHKNFLRNDTLISTATSNIFSSACSQNTLRPNTNGWFEYVWGVSTSNHVYIGFSADALSPNASDLKGIGYGIFVPSNNDHHLYYYESGTQAIMYTYLKNNDLIRIERIGNTINYKVNGITVRTVTVSGLSSKTLKLATVLQNNERIANVGCSFYNIDSTHFNNYIRVNPTIKHSSGIGINDGSIQLSGATSYTWQPGGQTTNTISLLNSGIYSVTVGDNLINTSAYNYNVAYKTQWTNLSNCFFRNDTLKGTGGSYSVSGYAYSKNILSATTDGYFEYVLKGVPASNNVVYIGFTDTTSHSLSTLTEIKYGFYLDGNNKYLYYYEGGSNASIYPYPRAGDILRIERVGNTINYKVNGLIMRTVTVSTIGANVYKLKARLTHNNELVNVGFSFTPQILTSVQHVSCQGLSDGAITTAIIGTSATYSYSWQPGSLSSSGISSLSIGAFSLTASTASVSPITKTYNVGYKTKWQNLNNCSVYGDTLKQTITGGVNSWDNGAVATNILFPYKDGWVEYVVSSLLYQHRIFGLLDSVESATGYTDFDYGIYLHSNKGIYRVNNGAINFINSYENGDIIRICRTGDTVYYKKNGVTIWSQAVPPSLLEKNWYLKASIYEYKGYLENIGCSFPSFNIRQVNTRDVNCIADSNGVATVYYTGGQSPYTFSWNGAGAVSSGTLHNLDAGTYTVQATDNNSCVASTVFTIYNCPKWTDQLGSVNINTSGDVIKTGGTDAWNVTSVATSTLEPFVFSDTIVCWLSFHVADTTSKYMIGFRSTEEDSTAQLTNYRLYVSNSILTIIETDNDGFYNKREIAHIAKNNAVKVQLTSQGIEYYMQKHEGAPMELIYTSKLFSNTPLIIENQIYKSGSRVNKIRLSGYGNTY